MHQRRAASPQPLKSSCSNRKPARLAATRQFARARILRTSVNAGLAVERQVCLNRIAALRSFARPASRRFALRVPKMRPKSQRPRWRGYRATQPKFAASSVLPAPLYFATCG